MLGSIKNALAAVKKYDFVLLFLAIAASLIGIVFVFSATKSMDNHYKLVIVQVGSFVLGLVSMIVVASLNYERLGELWRLVAGVSIALLVLVLLIGQSGGGTKGWIRFAGIGIQPSEIVKIGFVVTLSMHLSYIGHEINYIKNVGLLLCHLAVPVGLILLQPDFGQAFVYIFIFIVMIFMAGISWKYIAVGAGTGAAVCVLSWFFVLDTYQKQRIFAFLNPEAAVETYGYHVTQSKLAIGSGQLFGKGLFNGVQTQLNFLPEKHTDFIFAVIGEEAGLVGCTVVLALLLGLIVRVIRVGTQSKTDFGRFICIGVAAMWLFNTVENICMTIGLLPVTGVPLPFISYGGSSMVTNMIALGLVLSVFTRKKALNFC